MRSRKSQATPLADLLPGVLQSLRPDTRPSLERIEQVWRRIAGEKAASHSWPRSLQRGRLLVEVENSGWMYTLSPRRPQLLQGLIEWLGAGRVRDLSFRIGEPTDA
ncbi:MAG: DUF721 domain-containing protein [Candidatus Omnitrophica bacterium]|nr:DUF721 domain-containing protein [Candidatus Omnitrophota bacterium]